MLYFTIKCRIVSIKVFTLQGVFMDRNAISNINRNFTTFCDDFRGFIRNNNENKYAYSPYFTHNIKGIFA